jgi:hypothetical protein
MEGHFGTLIREVGVEAEVVPVAVLFPLFQMELSKSMGTSQPEEAEAARVELLGIVHSASGAAGAVAAVFCYTACRCS